MSAQDPIICLAALEHHLSEFSAEWDERASLGVVMAAGGYLESYAKGHVISRLPVKEQEWVKVFHAGTKLQDDQVVTSGVRVLCVTALGDSVGDAQKRAYDMVEKIQWDNVYYRTDIGYRAVAREKG